MNRAFISSLIALSLAACTPPLDDGASMELPTGQADRVAAGVSEPVTVTVKGSFKVINEFYKEKFTQVGVNLGACISYASDVATQGGLCPGGERPLPDGLSIVGDAAIAKNFGNITVKRGESRNIEHTFTFTSDRAGDFRLVPAYLFEDDNGIYSGYEPGANSILEITFE